MALYLSVLLQRKCGSWGGFHLEESHSNEGIARIAIT